MLILKCFDVPNILTFQRREMAKFHDQRKPDEEALPWIPPPIRSSPPVNVERATYHMQEKSLIGFESV